MVRLTKSLKKWLWDNHRKEAPLIALGHTELMTDEWWDAYLAWCRTDEAAEYLNQEEPKGGEHHGNKS